MAIRRERYQYPSPFAKNSPTAMGPGRPLPPHFSDHATIGLVSADAPRFSPQVHGGHEALGRWMDSVGLKYISTRGKYDSPERSYIVLDPTLEQMKDLGQRFGQESVVFSKGPNDHKLVYTNGEHLGKFRPGIGVHESFDTEPPNDFTFFPGYGFARLHFNWDAPPIALDAAGTPVAGIPAPTPAALAAGQDPVKKSEDLYRRAAQMVQPVFAHPHAYDWHDGHTDHHTPASPILKAEPAQAEHPHASGPPQENPHVANDQAAGVGVKTYAHFAQPYGTITPGKKTNLFHYRYEGKADAAKKLVADHGFRSYYAGGKYGKPDLANKNYNTKHLMIYDPSPESGASFQDEGYTDAWRHVHELAHALTYPQLNSIYGEGRRIGRLGVHRTMREALRAVHWEWLAAHKQRELSAQIGVHVPDDVFHRELNTVMHDAVHRAVTGKFTEPSDEGFEPHAHKVSLDHALASVTAEAQKLGLTDHNTLIRKHALNLHAVEGDYTLSRKITLTNEQRQTLAKSLKAKIETYKTQMSEMRERELRKSDVPTTPAPAGEFKVTVPDLANCPRCGNPDAPGSCTCLTKGEGKTSLFAGTENKAPKEPAVFSGAKKGANPMKKEEPAMFNGSTKSGTKQPSLFDRAHGGEDVMKEEPSMSLFSGTENTCDKEPELFSGARKGASPMVKKSESPIFKAQAAKNLCPTCQKSHQGPRCKGGPEMVKTEESKTKGAVLPSDKKSKVIPTKGSGGDVTKGKKVTKGETPMAKPPSGKNPTATPTSKPGKTGMPAPAAPAKPATGAAPMTKALGDFDRRSQAPNKASLPAQAPKRSASEIRGAPMGHIAGGARPKLPGAHLFTKPAPAPSVAPAPTVPPTLK